MLRRDDHSIGRSVRVRQRYAGCAGTGSRCAGFKHDQARTLLRQPSGRTVCFAMEYGEYAGTRTTQSLSLFAAPVARNCRCVVLALNRYLHQAYNRGCSASNWGASQETEIYACLARMVGGLVSWDGPFGTA